MAVTPSSKKSEFYTTELNGFLSDGGLEDSMAVTSSSKKSEFYTTELDGFLRDGVGVKFGGLEDSIDGSLRLTRHQK